MISAALIGLLVLGAPELRPALVPDGVALAAGDCHACVVRKDGTAVCWGDGRFFATGERAGAMTTSPTLVAGIDDARGVAAGLTTTCFLRKGGEVACMGAGFSPMTGDVSEPKLPLPVDVYPASRWARAVAVGGTRAAVVSAAGEVDFFATPAGLPIPVAGLADAVEVAVGWENVCARDARGGVRCFGPNWGGENGNGGDRENIEPVEVLAPREPTVEVLDNAFRQCRGGCDVKLSGAVALAMHGRTACVALASGRVACWGGGDEKTPMNLGRLGFARAPLYMPGIDDAIGVTVGDRFACAWSRAGVARCWGDNDHGQLGRVGPGSGAPLIVTGLHDVTAVAAGDSFACALEASGAVRCWGEVAPARPE